MLKRFGNDSVFTTLLLYMHYNKLLFSVTLREFQHGRIVIVMLWNGTSACTEADISDMEADISSTEAIIFSTTSMHSAMRLARKS
ncbi:hypothetical protein Pelo_6989 [Pelomyxa schiedti]|nr:hypothetical protein Pelo_6989 [Pelomyxa schiedti]